MKLNSQDLKLLVLKYVSAFHDEANCTWDKSALDVKTWVRLSKFKVTKGIESYCGKDPATQERDLSDYLSDLGCAKIDVLDPEPVTLDCWIRYFCQGYLCIECHVVTDAKDEKVLQLLWNAD